MGPSIYVLGMICIFIFLCGFVFFLAETLNQRRWKVASRLQYIKALRENHDKVEHLNLPFKERVILPAFRKLRESAVASGP